jgi:hypothetical protein
MTLDVIGLSTCLLVGFLAAAESLPTSALV